MSDYLVSDPSIQTVVVDSPVQTYIVASGGQGPAGRPGDGTTFRYPAGSNIGGHRAVIVGVNGSVEYADANTLSHAYAVLGVTIDASDGANVTVQRIGEISEPSWNWIPRQPVFLGLNGELTQVPPSPQNAVFSLVLGFASTETKLTVDVSFPIMLTA